MLQRNLLELLGQIWCRERPVGSIYVRSREPPAGDQIENRSSLAETEHVAFRITHPEKIRSRNRYILRVALNVNQLGRHVAEMNIWHTRQRFARQIQHNILPVVIG